MDANPTVLHVDDDPAVTRLVGAEFERAGVDADLRVAESAEAGSARLQRDPVDCLVTDGVTFADGELFADAVRERYPEMPIVLFTGSARADIGAHTLADRRTRFVRKGRPESLTDLVASVEEFLGERAGTWRTVGRHDPAGDRSLAASVGAALIAAGAVAADDEGDDLPDPGVDLAAAARFLWADDAGADRSVRFRCAGHEVAVDAGGEIRLRG